MGSLAQTLKLSEIWLILVPVPELGVQETSLQYKLLIHTVHSRTNKQYKMKLVGLLLVTGLAIAVASPEPQRGFFGAVRNFFGQRPRGGRRNRGRCSANQPNHDFGGKSYLVSWRSGCTSFSHGEGAAFCRSVGMQPISLDTPAKERHFTGLVAQERQKYFWTGGNVNHGRNPPSPTTERAMRTVSPSSTTSTTMVSSSTTCPATTESLSSARVNSTMITKSSVQ